MISTVSVDHSMEFTRGLIIIDIIIVAGAVAVAIFLCWSPRNTEPGENQNLNSPNKFIIENPTQ
jgi:hypothetical protein